MRLYLRARTCIRVSLRACTHINGNAVSCVRLRACYRAGLIKSQNAFARKKAQNSNTLWVQKLSGCTISLVTLCLHEPCSFDEYASVDDSLYSAPLLTSADIVTLRPPYTFQLSDAQPLHATKLKRVW